VLRAETSRLTRRCWHHSVTRSPPGVQRRRCVRRSDCGDQTGGQSLCLAGTEFHRRGPRRAPFGLPILQSALPRLPESISRIHSIAVDQFASLTDDRPNRALSGQSVGLIDLGTVPKGYSDRQSDGVYFVWMDQKCARAFRSNDINTGIRSIRRLRSRFRTASLFVSSCVVRSCVFNAPGATVSTAGGALLIRVLR